MLDCRSFESISIKNEFTDMNISSIYTCNDDKSPSLVKKQSTNRFKEIKQISQKMEKRSRSGKRSKVWEYFKADATTKATVICNMCGNKVNCYKNWMSKEGRKDYLDVSR